MTMTLFGNLESGNVHKVQMLLRRRGIAYHRVDVAQTRGEPRRAQFLAINPMGKVPALRLDDGDVLTESGAILHHLARGTPLWPRAARAQTEVLRWMFFEQYSHEPTLAVMRYLRRFVDDPRAHAERVRALEPGARHAIEVLQGRLREQPWIAAARCTIADYALYPYTRMADESGLDLDEYPAVQSWLARMQREPGFLPVATEGAERVLAFAEYFSV